jgi:hypothetical protein
VCVCVCARARARACVWRQERLDNSAEIVATILAVAGRVWDQRYYCVCVCVCACVRVRARARACVCVCVCVGGVITNILTYADVCFCMLTYAGITRETTSIGSTAGG